MQYKNKKNGFTLIELLIAIAIFSIAIISIYLAFLIGIKTNKQAKNLSTSYAIANLEMETIRNTNFENLTVRTDGVFYSNQTDELAKLKNGQGKLTIKNYKGDQNTKEIIVKVDWQDDTTAKETILTTLITNGGN